MTRANRAALVTMAAALTVALAGCGSAAPNATGTASPASAPATAHTSVFTTQPRTAADRFYDDVMDTPGLTSSVPKQELVQIGQMICDSIGTEGVTYDNLVSAIGTSKWGPQVAKVVVDAAHANLCSGKPYAVSAPPPASAGPRTTFTEGVFVVGEDIEAGRYKASGGENCYWQRSTGDGSDIIDNHLGSGPAVATVKKGELFETHRCGTWTKS